MIPFERQKSSSCFFLRSNSALAALAKEAEVRTLRAVWAIPARERRRRVSFGSSTGRFRGPKESVLTFRSVESRQVSWDSLSSGSKAPEREKKDEGELELCTTLKNERPIFYLVWFCDPNPMGIA